MIGERATLPADRRRTTMTRPALSVQLYSVRDALDADPAATLATIARLGFTAVEPFGLPLTASVLAPLLEQNGLQAPTAHASVLDDPDSACRAAMTLGVDLIVEPYQPRERFADRDSVRQLAVELRRAAEIAADHGLRLGYHNHAWELESRLDGTSALAVLADLAGDSVLLELDAYWCSVGGEDPVALADRLGHRIAAVHVKDGPLSGDPMEQVPVGAGEIPLAAVIAALPEARLVIEFDEYSGDLFEGIAASRDELIAMGAAA
jgi:sugar phosphate isomerase/epimerase